MSRPLYRIAAAGLVASLCLGICTQARAHFPWLALDNSGRAIYFFGENPADREYHMPESVAAAEVHHLVDGNAKPLADLQVVETDSLIGRRSEQKIPSTGQLQATVVYGNYHGMKLTYVNQLILGTDPATWSAKPSGKLDLEAVLTEQDGGLAAQIFWRGKPMPKAKVQLFCEEGHEEGSETTDAKGFVRFTADQIEEGLNGLLVGHVDKESPGELDGEPYTGEAHYLTVTFVR